MTSKQTGQAVRMKPWYRRSKFYAAVISGVAAFLGDLTGMDPETIVLMISGLISYILGESYIDGQSARTGGNH